MTWSSRRTWSGTSASRACPGRVSTSIRKTDPNRYVSPSAKSLRHWMRRRDGWKSCEHVCKDAAYRAFAGGGEDTPPRLYGATRVAAKVAALPQETALYFASMLRTFPESECPCP